MSLSMRPIDESELDSKSISELKQKCRDLSNDRDCFQRAAIEKGLEIVTLREALGKDKARLDWIISNGALLHRDTTHQPIDYWVEVQGHHQQGEYDNARDAIDAAMKEENAKTNNQRA